MNAGCQLGNFEIRKSMFGCMDGADNKRENDVRWVRCRWIEGGRDDPL